jgi:protein tyrosine/serine phosphatase
MKSTSILACLALFAGAFLARAQGLPAPAATQPVAKSVELVPSEDPVIKDFHSLGLIDGRVDIFRCASPVRDLGTPTTSPSDHIRQADEAESRIHHLYDLGIRTIICLEDPDHPDRDESGSKTKAQQLKARIALESAAAAEPGISFIIHPINNAGPHSLENMSDSEVQTWLDQVTNDILNHSQIGGVAFHCSAGHDRTGIVAAYIRIKYEHWPVDQAIEEMRRYGHNWRKFSHNGGVSSWQEDHLRAIAKTMETESTSRPAN